MKCSGCQMEIEDDGKFCSNCGCALNPVPAGKACPDCGSELKAAAAFCSQCGSRAGNASGKQPPLRLSLKGKNSGLSSYDEFYELSCELPLREPVLNALGKLGWKVGGDNGNSITALVGMSLLSWGETVEINFGLNRQISISSRCRAQLFDWNKNKANVEKFMQALSAELQQAEYS